MTNTETKYEILVDRLRNVKPVATNPEMLTDEIIASIARQNETAATPFLAWVRPVMTAAALFLLGLLSYQQVETTNVIQETSVSRFVKPAFQNKANCSSDAALKLPENRKLLNKYICYMKSNQAENENSKQFYQKFLPKNKASIIQ
ncbi:MAG: hypothetical protein WC780_07240 [Lentimicrobiaceae bacterium]|jgi:hypothetical protein